MPRALWRSWGGGRGGCVPRHPPSPAAESHAIVSLESRRYLHTSRVITRGVTGCLASVAGGPRARTPSDRGSGKVSSLGPGPKWRPDCLICAWLSYMYPAFLICGLQGGAYRGRQWRVEGGSARDGAGQNVVLTVLYIPECGPDCLIYARIWS